MQEPEERVPKGERVYKVQADDAGRRFDRVARRLFPGMPLAGIFRAIRTGAVLVNGSKASPSGRVELGDLISAPGVVNAGTRTRPRAAPAGSSIEPLLLFEDEHALAINKPPGMPVHGPDSAETIVSAYLASRTPESLSFRPGPAHRLDRGTSGLLLFSRSLAGAQALARLFRERSVSKEYLALVQGEMSGEETWTDRIDYDHESRIAAPGGDREAVTRVRALTAGGGTTLLACFPLTGRTHQIRAQAALHGHPLAGDEKYGGRPWVPNEPAAGYLLHALAVSLEEPAPPLGFRRIVAPAPPRMLQALASLLGRPALDAVATRQQG